MQIIQIHIVQIQIKIKLQEEEQKTKEQPLKASSPITQTKESFRAALIQTGMSIWTIIWIRLLSMMFQTRINYHFSFYAAQRNKCKKILRLNYRKT